MAAKIYLAADPEKNADLIRALKKLPFDFVSPHEKIAASHMTLSCDIKNAIDETFDGADGFLAVVGEKTPSDAGGCENCDSYNAWFRYCGRDLRHSRTVDYNGFFEYACKRAIGQKCRIVVLYDGADVNRENCPPLLKNRGEHIAAYSAGKKAFNTAVIQKALTA